MPAEASGQNKGLGTQGHRRHGADRKAKDSNQVKLRLFMTVNFFLLAITLGKLFYFFYVCGRSPVTCSLDFAHTPSRFSK